METKIIMRYKREKAAWICWNCEMENDMTGQECYFCRAKRANARVVKSWAEEAAISSYDHSQTENSDASFSNTGAKHGFKDGEEDVKKRAEAEASGKEDSLFVPVLLWALLLVVIVIVIAIASL